MAGHWLNFTRGSTKLRLNNFNLCELTDAAWEKSSAMTSPLKKRKEKLNIYWLKHQTQKVSQQTAPVAKLCLRREVSQWLNFSLASLLYPCSVKNARKPWGYTCETHTRMHAHTHAHISLCRAVFKQLFKNSGKRSASSLQKAQASESLPRHFTPQNSV